MNTMNLTRRAALGLGVLLALSAQAQQPPVTIGALVPLTGNSASDGAWLMKGHELAIEEANARGGIRSLGGAKLVLAVGDTQSKPETARGEAERLIDREKASALVGAWASAVTTAVTTVAERQQVPFLITSAVADVLTERGQRFVFRVSPKSKWSVEDAGRFLEHMRSRGVPVGKVAVIYEDGPYGQSVSKNYKAWLEAKGIPVVAEDSFRTGVSDLSTQVTKMRAAGAEVVLMAAYVNDSIVLFRAMAAQNFKPLVLGYGQGHVQPALLQSGKAVEGSFAIVEWMPDVKKEAAQKFVAAFQARYKTMPYATSAQAYAATWALIEAVEKAGSAKPEAVRDALAAPAQQDRALRHPAQRGVPLRRPGPAPGRACGGADPRRPVRHRLAAGGGAEAHRAADALTPPKVADCMTQTDVVLQAVVSGLLTGGVYALVAMGLTLIFGVMRVVNFAHGDFLMLAMYGAYFGWAQWGMDPLFSVLWIVPGMALLGVVFHKLVLQRVAGSAGIGAVAVTLGVALLVQNLALMLFKADNRVVNTEWASRAFALGPLSLQWPQAVAALAAGLLIAALAALLRFSPLGLAMRAVAQSADGAALSGIDPQRVALLASSIGIGSLGVAGALLTPMLYVNPGVGVQFTLMAFVVVIAGGMGSFAGAVLAGLGVGVTERVASLWLPASAATAIPFALLVLVMLWRPQGLLRAGR